MEAAGFDDEDDRTAPTTADLLGRLAVRGKMDVMPRAAQEALAPDRIEKPVDRAVIQEFRRFERLQA